LVRDKIRVAVVDPDPLFRQGIVQTIAHSGRLVLVAEGASLEEAEAAAAVPAADVLIFDLSIPDGGFDGIKEVISRGLACKLVVMTSLAEVASVPRALAAGIQGYVLKGITGAELIEAIETIHGGQPYLSPELASGLLRQAEDDPSSAIGAEREKLELSYRERQVLARISRGLTNKEIALQLGLNERTIKHYLTQLFKKMRVRNRLQAIQSARRLTGCC
jgi:two-component system, NarL family, nitrate/nitrite response regulator NarL